VGAGPYLTRSFYSLVGEKCATASWAHHGQTRRALDRRRHQISPARTLCSAATGAPSSIIHSCISELCYYQAIDYAIAHKLARVEAGAQGEHKISRGYMQRRPIRRTTSPTRACGAPLPITWCASAPMSRRPVKSLQPAPFRKDFVVEPE